MPPISRIISFLNYIESYFSAHSESSYGHTCKGAFFCIKSQTFPVMAFWIIYKYISTYDAKRQGPARNHVHFLAVSHVTGISGIFWFILTFLPLRAQFSSELPETLFIFLITWRVSSLFHLLLR